MTGARGVDAVAEYLDAQGVPYEPVEHRETFAASDEARAAGFPSEAAAKTVVLQGDRGYRLAVVPASERLDLHKAREALGESKRLQLATEAEMAEAFERFEVGALPPLGPMVATPELLDPRLLEHDRIICAAGDHRHSVLLDPREIVRVADPRVVDICEE